MGQVQRESTFGAIDPQVCMRDLDTAQVIKIIRLAEVVESAGRTSPADHSYGVLADAIHDRPTALLKLVGWEILLVVHEFA